MIKIQNYINGSFVDSVTTQTFNNTNPATGKTYSSIPDSNSEDVELAYKAAQGTFLGWKSLSINERSQYLLKIASEIQNQLNELALAETIDNGKPLWLAKKVDIPRAAANFHFYGTGILHWDAKAHFMEGEAVNYTTHNPIGVAGCISPWNLPLYLFTWKIAPALATGNTVVAKPSEVTPMTAYLLSKICDKVGLPKGVLNIVHGYGNKVGSAIVSHTKIPVISFTGGTSTGAEIARIAAPMFKKLSLELGGKNPNIIFSDCNFEQALKTTVSSSFANQGQICLCGSRVFIQEDIYEKFKNALIEKTNKLVVGDPEENGVTTGAMVSEQHMKKVLSYIELAKQEGGNVLVGGKQKKLEGRCAEGYFIEPTIIEGLTQDCRTNQEEIFGPVITIESFKTEEEVIEKANSTKYGLSATVWTEDVRKSHRVAHNLDAGIIWVNTWLLRDLRTPFGGVKNSGVGREGGFEAFQFFTEPKNICIKL